MIASFAPILYFGYKEFIESGVFPLKSIISGYEFTYVCVAMIWAVLAEIAWNNDVPKTPKHVCVTALVILMICGVFSYTIGYDNADQFAQRPDIAARLMGGNIWYLIFVSIFVFVAFIVTSIEKR
jgi:biotin transporter BioY